MPPVNPYSAGGMVTDPAMFFGRDEELKRVRDRLRKGDSTAVVGLRRIGKSSLLYQLAHQTGALPDGVVAVYLDLQEAAHYQPVSLLNAAWQGLNQQLSRRDDSPLIKNLADFSKRVKKMATDGLRPVLCLDEVEQLTDSDAFDDDFFEGLRSLGNQRALAFVTASGKSLDVLIKQGGRTSEFYNIFVNLELGGLSDEAARTLLTEPFRAASLNLPPDNYVAEVLDLAGHYPFYLQMAAYHLFEARASGGVLNRLALREAFTRDAERHFRGLWRHLSPEEQAGVKKLAGLPAVVRDWERTHTALIRCGLAEGDPEALHLFSAVFAEMVKTGEIERESSSRPLRPPRRTTPEERPATPPLYAYALVALASAVVALFIALLLPSDRFWPFFVILTVVLTFILVLADKLTGGQFLEWLSKLLGK